MALKKDTALWQERWSQTSTCYHPINPRTVDIVVQGLKRLWTKLFHFYLVLARVYLSINSLLLLIINSIERFQNTCSKVLCDKALYIFIFVFCLFVCFNGNLIEFNPPRVCILCSFWNLQNRFHELYIISTAYCKKKGSLFYQTHGLS